MTENMEGVEALVVDDEVIAIEMPDTVELPIVETAPGVRGNSATGRTKPATLSTGLVVQVPEHLDQGVDRPGRHPDRRVPRPGRLSHRAAHPATVPRRLHSDGADGAALRTGLARSRRNRQRSGTSMSDGPSRSSASRTAAASSSGLRACRPATP